MDIPLLDTCRRGRSAQILPMSIFAMAALKDQEFNISLPKLPQQQAPSIRHQRFSIGKLLLFVWFAF